MALKSYRVISRKTAIFKRSFSKKCRAFQTLILVLRHVYQAVKPKTRRFTLEIQPLLYCKNRLVETTNKLIGHLN
jgi:hypothetical protein